MRFDPMLALCLSEDDTTSTPFSFCCLTRILLIWRSLCAFALIGRAVSPQCGAGSRTNITRQDGSQ
jgi:hypothetical protein